MCLAAYPGGLASIRETTEWRDTITSLLLREDGGELPEALLLNPPDTVVRTVIADVLRLLHARRAKELPFVEWTDQNGSSEPFIEDLNLRAFYCPVPEPDIDMLRQCVLETYRVNVLGSELLRTTRFR